MNKEIDFDFLLRLSKDKGIDMGMLIKTYAEGFKDWAIYDGNIEDLEIELKEYMRKKRYLKV